MGGLFSLSPRCSDIWLLQERWRTSLRPYCRCLKNYQSYGRIVLTYLWYHVPLMHLTSLLVIIQGPYSTQSLWWQDPASRHPFWEPSPELFPDSFKGVIQGLYMGSLLQRATRRYIGSLTNRSPCFGFFLNTNLSKAQALQKVPEIPPKTLGIANHLGSPYLEVQGSYNQARTVPSTTKTIIFVGYL